MKQKTSFIAYVAGKSAGHIVPALTHADQECRADTSLRVLFFSTNTPLDRSLLASDNRIHTYVPLSLIDVPYKKVWLWPVFIVQSIIVFFRSAYFLINYRPQRLISMGGYISIPVSFIAWIMHIPVEVYELNAVPGQAVKLISRWATKTHVCFKESRSLLPARACCMESDYPIRFTSQDRFDRAQACQRLGIELSHKIILILGGSQGSHFINTLVTEYLVKSGLLNGYFVIHQTGAAELERVVNSYTKSGTRSLVFSYRPDIAVCYSAADIIIARAGAGTLFEISFFDKPSIIIPLEALSTTHQKDNAYALQRAKPTIFKVVLQHEVAQNPLLFLNAFGHIVKEKA